MPRKRVSASLSGTKFRVVCITEMLRFRLEELDRALARTARSAGALRLALGGGLEALAKRGGHHELGFSSLGAYAQECSGCAPRTADEARSLARRLEGLPRTRVALLAGEIAWAMAVLVARVATPGNEAEWLSAARELTVRQMRERIQQHREAQAQAPPAGAGETAPAEPHGGAPDSGEAHGAGLDGGEPDGGEPHGGEADSASGFHVRPPRMKTLTITVDAIDAWIFECARWVALRTSGGVSDEAVMEALLGEGESSLLDLIPREAITEAEQEPGLAAQAAWEAQLAAWRREAEERCEANFRKRHAEALRSAMPIPQLDDLKTRSAEELDTWLCQIARDLAERDAKLGRFAEQFWKADGWRRLGYATERQYARERLGLSLTAVKDKRWLARRLDALPELADALGSGDIGSEAARLVARVATPETMRDWVARATQSTVKHLREEVAAAELLARLTDAPRVPPDDETLAAVHRLETMVTSGAAFEEMAKPAAESQTSAVEPGAKDSRADPGQTSAVEPGAKDSRADPGQTSAVDMTRALSTLVHCFDATRRAAGPVRFLGRVTLKLRVSEENYWHYRSRQRLHRRFGPPGPFLRFLCFALIGTWRHALRSGVAYEHVYARDRFRCASPVCTRRDVTPHHLVFRSHGGGDHLENLLSLCVWCHLNGIHQGRLSATAPASAVRWVIGRSGHTVIEGRRKVTPRNARRAA